jgi:hypothetical protein
MALDGSGIGGKIFCERLDRRPEVNELGNTESFPGTSPGTADGAQATPGCLAFMDEAVDALLTGFG